MKILFLLGASSRIRNFDHAIELLVERGHSVHMTGRPRKGAFALPKTMKHERISGGENPTERCDEWREFVETLRGVRDYVRYLDPRYAQATRLVRRAYEIAPTGFVLFCERHPWVKRRWRVLTWLLALCEDLIPSDPGFEAFLRDQHPDIVLVTPLVTFESYQTDYVKAAHRLGLPIAFLPFSWDNLTNKGLMRIHPDRVLVWNDTQGREAVDLHGVRPDSVVVTGAARFDDFFSRGPSATREEFFGQYGLDPARPMVLYLGSSQLTGPNEMELVRRWGESLRGAADPGLRACGILVRPHPALKDSWTTVDLSDLGNVAVSLHASRNADQELFDSLYHAHAAVGLNTSAMLEAGIAGRPVHTLMIPGFDEGQVGTIHFRYLVEAYGGLASVARSFAEHHEQLAPVLRGEPAVSDRSRRFVEAFLRPHGIGQPVSPLLAGEIERVAAISKRPQTFTPPWRYPLRWALRRWLQRGAVSAHATEDTSVVGTSMSLRPVKTALQELHDGSAPIFVGPWLDSLANEILYWIPFVRWAAKTYGLAPERLIVISRGSARHWYGSLAGRYLDAPTLFSTGEREEWQRRTIAQSQQNPKQSVMYPFDQEIVERAARAFDLSDYQVLHPLSFFRVLRRLQADRAMNRIGEVLLHERLVAPPKVANRFPDNYVAASLAFSESLPENPRNRAFLNGLLEQAAASHDIVLVDYPRLTNVEALGVPSGRVRVLDSEANEKDYLAVQTQVIAGAQAFIGAYGGLSLLASFCGTPAFTYHSETIPADELEIVRALHGWGPVSVEQPDDSPRLHLAEGVPS